MQFSLRTIFALVTAFSISLVLTRYHFTIAATIMTVAVVLIAALGRDPIRQRAIIYGAVGGVACFILMTIAVAWSRGEFPQQNYLTPDTTSWAARKYAFPVGALIGGLAGCFFADLRNARTGKKSRRHERNA